MRIFVTGATGMIGVRLIRRLVARGDSVVALTRRENAFERIGTGVEIITGNPKQPGDWQQRINDCDAVVNLAGAGIFDRRWNVAYKRELLESRLQSTDNVVAALKQAPKRADGSPKVLVSASATGYYGPRGDEAITEEAPPGKDFVAQICMDWEQAARHAESAGVRVVLIRTGIVQDALGGALAQVLLPFKLGAGGPVASGRQYWSWIHHADEVGILTMALDHPEAAGPINATAPNPVTSKEYAQALGQVLHRPAFMPAPAFALRLALGEVAQIITTGQRVLPAKALTLGYQFQFPVLEPALRAILKQTND